MDSITTALNELAQVPHWLAFALIVLGTLVSEDLSCIAAAMAAASGQLPTPLAFSAAMSGIWLGDIGLWWIGSRLRGPILAGRGLGRWIRPERLEQCRSGLERHRNWWIVLTRLLPGVRTPTYILAGATGTSFPWFAGATFIAVAVWTPAIFYATFTLGVGALDHLHSLGASAWMAMPLIVLGYLLLTRLFIPLLHPRGRATLAARWQRLPGAESGS